MGSFTALLTPLLVCSISDFFQQSLRFKILSCWKEFTICGIYFTH